MMTDKTPEAFKYLITKRKELPTHNYQMEIAGALEVSQPSPVNERTDFWAYRFGVQVFVRATSESYNRYG